MSLFSDARLMLVDAVFDEYSDSIDIKVGNVWVAVFGILRNPESDTISGDLIITDQQPWCRFKIADIAQYGLTKGTQIRQDSKYYRVNRPRPQDDGTTYYDLKAESNG